MNLKQVKSLVLAAAVTVSCFAAGSGEAAGSEEQLSFLINQSPVWSSAPFYADWLREKGTFAVTDLDRNGRLELFFVTTVREQVPGGKADGTKEERALEFLSRIPVARKISAFEVSADGKKLEEIKFRYTDGQIVPDMYYLSAEFYNTDDNIRFYPIKTMVRTGLRGYRLYHQVIALKDGSLTVQTVGTEYGKYVTSEKYDYTEAVADYCETRHGERMNEKEIADYAMTYLAGTSVTGVRAYWIPADNLDGAVHTGAGALREVLEESLRNFVYEKR